MNFSRVFFSMRHETSLVRNVFGTCKRWTQTASDTQQNAQVLKNSKGLTTDGTAQSANKTNELDKLYKTIELELKGNDSAVLNSYAKFASFTAKNLDIQSKTWNLRKPKKERFTMYKSVHIFKRHKAQYELRTYFTFVQFKHVTGSTCDTLLEYLQRNLPEGVALKTTKVELQQFPEHLFSDS